MRKIFIILFLFIFTVPVFAYTDYGIQIGSTLTLSLHKLIVVDEMPNEFNQIRPVATLPKGTNITIKDTAGEWNYIEWYSNANKTYKRAWTSTTAICLSTAACTDTKALLDHLALQVGETEYGTKALGAFNNKEYSSVIKFATKAISAIFSIICDPADSGTNISPKLKQMLMANYSIRSIAYYYLGDIENAINDVSESIYYLPISSSYLLRGKYYEESGYYSKAKADYLKVKTYAIAERNEKEVIEINQKIKELDKLINQAR